MGHLRRKWEGEAPAELATQWFGRSLTLPMKWQAILSGAPDRLLTNTIKK